MARPLRRRPDWAPRLKATVKAWEGRPFVWGQSDCVCFASACLEAVTGRDLMRGRRGTYTSRLQARARLLWWKHPTLTAAAGEALAGLGAVEVPPAFAMVGDIGATGDDVLCVRLPSGFAARTPKGKLVTAVAVKSWAIAWPEGNP